MARSIGIGLIGCGVVGQGVIKLLRDNAESIRARLGAPLEVRRIVVRDVNRQRIPEISHDLVSTDAQHVLGDPDVDIVVEVMGGIDPAGAYVRAAIESGKGVVTANKALLAEKGHELLELAEAKKADLYFEAAVAGGIPIIRVLREALASDRVVALRGIINGTSNYILSMMQEKRTEFAGALKSAQAAGYAEADPTLDVGGGDAAHKLTILATLAFGAKVSPGQVSTEGIDQLSALDFDFAEQFGYVVKPLAIARIDDAGSLDLRVHPALVGKRNVLANISGALNAVYVEGAAVGPCLLSGYGAGAMPTAVSVVSDVIDVGRNLLAGSRGRVPQRSFRGEHLVARNVRPIGDHVGRYYLRFSVLDRPGVLSQIAGVLGTENVSIEQMVQRGRAVDSDTAVSIVMLTHAAKESNVRKALNAIERRGVVTEAPRSLRIE